MFQTKGFLSRGLEGRNTALCRYASSDLWITSKHLAWTCFLAGLISLQRAPCWYSHTYFLHFSCLKYLCIHHAIIQHSAALIQLQFVPRTYLSLTCLDVCKIIPHFLLEGHGSLLDFPQGSWCTINHIMHNAHACYGDRQLRNWPWHFEGDLHSSTV